MIESLDARQLLAAIGKFDFDADAAEPGPAGHIGFDLSVITMTGRWGAM